MKRKYEVIKVEAATTGLWVLIEVREVGTVWSIQVTIPHGIMLSDQIVYAQQRAHRERLAHEALEGPTLPLF